MNSKYRHLLDAARDDSIKEGYIRMLMRSALESGEPKLPAEHFAMGYAIGKLESLVLSRQKGAV